ncbi:MAG: pyruvate kinase [Deltaproteobacteria bacterium]|nr:pyruvate kinase [Deltaproteobacteria bacterium]
MRRTKIICTIGPTVHSPAALEKLLASGMDVARLNFSHGTQAEHAQAIEWLRAASVRVGKTIAIIGDLQGPKIRTGNNRNNEPIELKPGQRLLITTEPIAGTAERLSTTYPHFAEDVHPGDRILLDDGQLELQVLTTDGVGEVVTEVVLGGMLGPHKGINMPGVNLRAEAITAKDRGDLEFALKAGVDYIALSFVRRPQDIVQARQIMESIGHVVPLIAKIEKPEALVNLDAILAVTDGVMVARGDLGVELALEQVPVVQKEIIRQCNKRGLPVIIATQMLNSMIEHPRPTRAEASDVANATFDCADAVMLSGETASGRYPVEAVQMMDRIVRAAEEQIAQEQPKVPPQPTTFPAAFSEVACSIACRAAQESGATLIAAFTMSGLTVRLLSHFRPNVPIIAFSPVQAVRRRIALLWGSLPRIMEPLTTTEEMVKRVEEDLLASGLAQPGDRIVITLGAPMASRSPTNSIRLYQLSSTSPSV